MQSTIAYGSSGMSYNMIDLNLYERIDCRAEQHYHRTFAKYQKYLIKIPRLSLNNWTINVELIIEENEANDPKYAEMVIEKNCTLSYRNLYDSDPIDKLIKGLDALLNPYYIVEAQGDDILLTAKIKGRVPSIQTPSVKIDMFDVVELQAGCDTEIFVMKPNEIHLPKTTFGNNYKPPKIGDVIYLIDSVKDERDRTFIRTILEVETHARCTCDVLTLDLPIDRLKNDRRINGIGLHTAAAISNNYTASFDKTQIWRRKDNFKELFTRC